jgi:hypothetical protein
MELVKVYPLIQHIGVSGEILNKVYKKITMPYNWTEL